MNVTDINTHEKTIIISLFLIREREREIETDFVSPSKSSSVSEQARPKPSVIRSSAVSVPLTAITTHLR